MNRAFLRIRHAARDERGFTLVELAIASSLMMTVLAVFASSLISVQRAAIGQDRRSQNNDQARLAVEALDREIRSANYIYDPANTSYGAPGVPAGFALRIYTQTNAPTRSPAPGYLCVLWQITSDNKLQTRNWPPLQPSLATAWRTIATGIVNRDPSINVTAFSMDTDASKGWDGTTGRAVNMVIMANDYLSSLPNATVRIELAVTGRNTSYGFPSNVCSATPA